MAKKKQEPDKQPVISVGKRIATSQRVGYLEPEECVLFCELLKKAKIKFVEQPSGNIRLVRVAETKFYSDKINDSDESKS